MIIGITGYTGAGKSVVANILEKKGFKILEMRDAVVEEMKKQHKEITSQSLREFSTKLRQARGNDIVARLTYAKIKKLKGKNIAITGMRSTYEEAYFKSKIDNFVIIAVVAPEKLRFERIRKRNKPDDPKTLAEFKSIEEKELNGFSGKRDPRHGLKMLVEHADFLIFNTGTMSDLRKDVFSVIDFLSKTQRNRLRR
ncbi:MAG: AAA family ATPase [Candidatus Micrarchaeia archaeon]